MTKARSSRHCSFHKPFERAELGADVHLVHGRVEPHPRIAPGERPGVVGERLRHLRVLEVLQPVGQAEVAQVHDRHDAEPLHLGGDLVEEGPVISARAPMDEVQRRAVAQVAQAEIPHELEVGAPVAVMAAGRHLVHAPAPALEGRIAALDAGGEHEPVLGRLGSRADGRA